MRLLNIALLLVPLTLAAALVACGGGSATKGGTVTATQATATEATLLGPTAIQTEAQPIPTPLTTLPTVSGQPTVTSSGLQIYELQLGSGAEARAGSIIQIRYSEWLPSGLKIDETVLEAVQERLTPGHVLQGWLEGIPGMKEGGKRRLVIPPELAYGAQGQGSIVPPNSTIIDDIELIAVVQP